MDEAKFNVVIEPLHGERATLAVVFKVTTNINFERYLNLLANGAVRFSPKLDESPQPNKES